MSPTSRPVNIPSTDSATVPSAPVRPEPARDGRGELVRRCGDQPHLLAGVEVHLGEFAGAGPDLVGDDLVVDLFAQGDQLLDRAALDEGKRFAPTGGDVVAVLLAEQLKLGLRVDESEHVAIGEVVARGQPAAEMHRGGALHQRVIHVEERGGGQVDRRLRATLARRRLPVNPRAHGRRWRWRPPIPGQLGRRGLRRSTHPTQRKSSPNLLVRRAARWPVLRPLSTLSGRCDGQVYASGIVWCHAACRRVGVQLGIRNILAD